jgi:putative molybdopterin biosynthesis protein
VAVAAGPGEVEADHESLGGWTREWGLVVPADNPQDVSGLSDLVDRDLSFVNRGTNSGLRSSLGDAIADLADERGTTRHDLTEAIAGFDLTVKAHESPARKVAAGQVDAGLGLRATAEKLDLGFVSLGTQSVRVLADPDRTEKAGVERLRTAIGDGEDVFASLAGFEPGE